MNTKTTIRIILLVALLCTAVGVAIAGQTNPLATPPTGRAFMPSDVIFGDQSIPLRFFHDKHIADGMTCVECHEKAETSLRATDILVPHGPGEDGMELCTTCHDVEDEEADPPAKCSTCHTDAYTPKYPEGKGPADFADVTNPPPAMLIPTPNLKMNHKIHMDAGIKCAECHGTMKNIQLATRENSLPLMNTCMTCHDGSKASADCSTCHLTGRDGRLKTTFGTGVLKPAGHYRNDAHDDNYLRNHAKTATGDDAYCAQCHSESYCLECHNGVSRPLKVHPNNWIITHPLSARRNNPTCSSCHRSQTYCLDCHKRMKVVSSSEMPSSKSGQAFDNKTRFARFHPPGWVTPTTGSVRGPNHHAFQAQRNMRACASCHTERTCMKCHSTSSPSRFFPSGGSGISPHGPGFANSRKCNALLSRNKRVCTKCHTEPQASTCSPIR